jgi:imidazole glycerol-phosphate synthase subunit HisH
VTVTLIDSPVANVANIARALRAAGAELDVTRDARAVAAATKIVLPGVGAFRVAMQFLEAAALDTAIRDAVANGAFLLGICVGHQLLFDVSHENGTTRGLGLLRGEVQRVDGPLPVPQIGWNRLFSRRDDPQSRHPEPAKRGEGSQVTQSEILRRATPAQNDGMNEPRKIDDDYAASVFGGPLFEGIAPGTPFYFVNSFAARDVDSEIASAEYNGTFTAAARQERVFGVQFHPEKSSAAGLRVLRNFVQCN